jgi:CheY-like chemotaxis protein
MSAILQNAVLSIVKRKKLLLVDPDPEVDSLLSQVVTSEGWDIERASDNETAVLLVKARPFDLVITGQKTSGHEDVELLRQLRTIRPHVRMIILSERSTPEDVIASLRENAFSYFRPRLIAFCWRIWCTKQFLSLVGTMALKLFLLRPIGFG